MTEIAKKSFQSKFAINSSDYTVEEHEQISSLSSPSEARVMYGNLQFDDQASSLLIVGCPVTSAPVSISCNGGKEIIYIF